MPVLIVTSRAPVPMLGFFALFLVAACTSSPPGAGPTSGDGYSSALREGSAATWLRTELYFGMNQPKRAVSDSEWQNFVQEVITPRFPKGLTILGGYGQWQDQTGQIQREGARLLILLHPRDRTVDEKIEEVRQIYCQRFHQESVLRVTSLAKVSF